MSLHPYIFLLIFCCTCSLCLFRLFIFFYVYRGNLRVRRNFLLILMLMQQIQCVDLHFDYISLKVVKIVWLRSYWSPNSYLQIIQTFWTIVLHLVFSQVGNMKSNKLGLFSLLQMQTVQDHLFCSFSLLHQLEKSNFIHQHHTPISLQDFFQELLLRRYNTPSKAIHFLLVRTNDMWKCLRK